MLLSGHIDPLQLHVPLRELVLPPFDHSVQQSYAISKPSHFEWVYYPLVVAKRRKKEDATFQRNDSEQAEDVDKQHEYRKWLFLAM